MCFGRSVEGMEEYQRVATNFEKGLSVIQEEIHRMRMVTKAQVDSLAIDRQVRNQSHLTRKQRSPASTLFKTEK